MRRPLAFALAIAIATAVLAAARARSAEAPAYDLVIRNGRVLDGEVVVDHGRVTGARPGRIVYKPGFIRPAASAATAGS